MRQLTALGVLVLVTIACAQTGDLRNWFNDPFFQLTSAVPGCIEPAGPRVTAAESLAQSHRRAEKGTTCWLAKEQDCERSSAYSYDQDIAAHIRSALPAMALPGTSLWVTVHGRVVYVEGCVQQELQGFQAAAAIRALPHVQQVIAIVSASPAASAPYRVLGRR